MQPETAQQRLPDPWPFSPVRGPGSRPVPGQGSPDESRTDEARTDEARTDEARTDADELVARLRSRRSASGVAAAYAAAHGHPTDPRPEQGARRWALKGKTAVVALVAVLLLGVGVAALSLGGDGVEPLTQLAADGSVDGQTGGPAGSSAQPVPSAPSGPLPAAPAPGSTGAADGGLLVHVVGEVAEPGLVTVPDGARVADALEAAGGTTRKADLTAVNLARAVVDGEQLYVPRPGEQPPGAAAPGAGGPAPGAGGPGTGGPGAGDGATGATVDINTADAAALETLPGIGPSIAQAIVEWRTANGQFASVDELEDVPGIGPATLAEIRDSARVGP
ncbi:helix-hairpin-helix domain-containing protein [Promicromonospora sp. NPDC023805]|uniref:helix-hairpin-helix domain-containing protein n=1 Tax=Promicromonospora sp. NPDC023805 TaxID=3154696 RepID=UPI0033FF0322